jgi:hypothetical protein
MSHAQAEPVEFASPDAGVMAKLEEYTRTKAPLALQQAADAAALHDEESPPDPSLALQFARQRVAGWLAILELINQELDTGFDPEEPPEMTVSPPPDTSGAQLPPGVSPKDVKDPAARQKYIEAIEQNRARLADYRRMSKLADAHEVIIERAEPSILDAHTTLGLSLDEIRALVQAADIRTDDRNSLLAALP